MTALACESCHVPHLYAPASQNYDWTVLEITGEPRVDCRGIEQEGATFATSLISGYEPVLLPRPNDDGDAPLSPHNLISSWYWVYGDEGAERPVPERDLQIAWLDGDSYQADVLAVFDTNSNGQIDEDERAAVRKFFAEQRGGKGDGGRFKEILKKFDKDGDGKLNDEERAAARKFMQENGGKGGRPSRDGKGRPAAEGSADGGKSRLNQEILKKFDKDGDGELNAEERKAARAARKASDRPKSSE